MKTQLSPNNSSKRIALCRPYYQAYVAIPPLGLGSLCSSIKQQGHRCRIFDPLQKPRRSNTELAKAIIAFDPDLLGISLTSDLMQPARSLINMLRQGGFRKPICVGGMQPTALPELTLRYTQADLAVIGEGELTFADLVARLDGLRLDHLTTIDGLAVRNGDACLLPLKSRAYADLNALPFPDWDEIDPRRYPRQPHGIYTKAAPNAPLMTSRGCPFSCSFCASQSMWSTSMRFRDSELILDEIDYLYRQFGIRELHFEDDNLTARRSHWEPLFTGLRQSGYGLHWKCPNGIRIDSITPELTAIMKEAGCYQVSVGIESGNQAILDKLGKHLRLETVHAALRTLKSSGIRTHGFFILGLPGETAQSAWQTLKLACDPYLDTAQFNIAAPIPGSALFEQYLEKRAEQNLDWNKLNVHTALLDGEQLSSRQIKWLQRAILGAYYFQPRHLREFLRYLKPEQAGNLVRILANFLG